MSILFEQFPLLAQAISLAPEPGVGFAAGEHRLAAAETALISALETPLAPIRAFLFFMQIPTGHTLVGGAIIPLAVFGSQFYGRVRKTQGV